MRAELSPLPVLSVSVFGLNATARTESLCPARVYSASFGSLTSHSLTVPSLLAVSSREPSVANATPLKCFLVGL